MNAAYLPRCDKCHTMAQTVVAGTAGAAYTGNESTQNSGSDNAMYDYEHDVRKKGSQDVCCAWGLAIAGFMALFIVALV